MEKKKNNWCQISIDKCCVVNRLQLRVDPCLIFH